MARDNKRSLAMTRMPRDEKGLLGMTRNDKG